MKYDLIAPCYFGTESAAAFDFKRIGAEDIAVTDGRVAFRGGPDIIAAANLWSRCAERVLDVYKRQEEEQGAFTFGDVCTGICKKLIYRHPHIFGEMCIRDSHYPRVSGKKARRNER